MRGMLSLLVPVLLMASVGARRTSSFNMLTNQIIAGYQGWFSFPGDGAPINKWNHWFHDRVANVTSPTADHLTIDFYPTTDEYDEDDLHDANIALHDGSKARFFSSTRPKVVLKHFEWMATYGITGVFHMRFMESLHVDSNREWKTIVLRNVRDAAELTGRTFAVSYNIAGSDFGGSYVLESLKVDWMRLVDEERITESSSYIHQNGYPVLRIYGIGFKYSNMIQNPYEMSRLIKWLQYEADEKYRVFVLGGVPTSWRNRTDDSLEDEAWKGVYDSLNGIHPWHVGRWRNNIGFQEQYRTTLSEDATYCKEKGILYMPTMWPGFSWNNLKDRKDPINDIPRNGGDFLWTQAHKFAEDPNITTVWLAQFDEVDEGTAIFKVTSKTSDLPAEGNWVALDSDGQSLPSDWYLRLAGEAQKMFEGKAPLTPTIPISPLDPAPCCWVVNRDNDTHIADDTNNVVAVNLAEEIIEDYVDEDDDEADDVTGNDDDDDSGYKTLNVIGITLIVIGVLLNLIAFASFVHVRHKTVQYLSLSANTTLKEQQCYSNVDLEIDKDLDKDLDKTQETFDTTDNDDEDLHDGQILIDSGVEATTPP